MDQITIPKIMIFNIITIRMKKMADFVLSSPHQRQKPNFSGFDDFRADVQALPFIYEIPQH